MPLKQPNGLLVEFGCCWVLLDVLAHCWMLLDTAGCWWMLLDVVECSGCCLLLLGVAECCKTLLGVAECGWVLLNICFSVQQMVWSCGGDHSKASHMAMVLSPKGPFTGWLSC